jgi:signal transduction histidine kinase
MKSLSTRLIIALVGVSVGAIVVLAVLVSLLAFRQFNNLIDNQSQERLVERLSDYYRQNESWHAIDKDDRHLLPPEAVLISPDGVLLLGEVPNIRAGESLPMAMLDNATEIMVRGKTVGFLLARPNRAVGMLANVRNRFVADFFGLVWLAVLGMAILASVVAVWLSQGLSRPLKELQKATQTVAEGQFGAQVPVRSEDEMGQLAQSFNQMSQQLANSQTLRRQMTADIAHELRTPLSVILGHTEALADGVLPASPETLSILYDEAQRLQRLIEDLRTLSIAEASELRLHLQPITVNEFLAGTIQRYQPLASAKNIQLATEYLTQDLTLQADPDRLTQVFNNLLSNALQHTPPDSKVCMSALTMGTQVVLTVQDSGAGIPESELENIFERFYRLDKSRNRTGESGSGLGLAIARAIVRAHGGEIKASNVAEGGLRMEIRLPIA